jgi:hypothetical protein
MTIWELYLHFVVSHSEWVTEDAKAKFASIAGLLLSAGANGHCRLPKDGLQLEEIFK